MQKTITKIIILLAVFTLALSVNYLFAAWSGPTQAPPGGNTPAPIHKGAVDQTKDAELSLDALAVFGAGWFQNSIIINSLTATPSTGGEQNLKLDVEGAIGAKYYCDEDGNNCASAPLGGSGGGVDKIIAGSNITVSPSSGVGNVTVSAKSHGDGSNCPSGQAAGGVDANGNAQGCISVPSAVVCTYGSKTYTTGARCPPSLSNSWNQSGYQQALICICQSDGSWNCTQYASIGMSSKICGN
jgi:hypothetical protein